MLKIEVKLTGNLGGLARRSWLAKPAAAGDSPRLVRRLAAPTTVKDFLEAAGIPHCEIGRVTVAGRLLGLDHLLNTDLDLEVAPKDPRPLADPRFVCDQHLGTLARFLRMMGFDTTWNLNWLEPEIVRRALNEQRVVLSRSRGLLKRKALDQALLIRSDHLDAQVGEVLRRFLLADRIQLFGRCTACNGRVAAVPKAQVRDRIPPRTKLWLEEFFLCRDCGQLYWEGTHVTAIRLRLAAIISRQSPPADPPEFIP